MPAPIVTSIGFMELEITSDLEGPSVTNMTMVTEASFTKIGRDSPVLELKVHFKDGRVGRCEICLPDFFEQLVKDARS